ncbi:NAF1-domain-containing protein [Wallemia mellicola]|nr:NAF1-domain-containing protein [Wallemia mellicola]TIB92168.1 NAF1-domain-containing protein [Wallemia mellicola]TIC37560.1 NAF1-domain-containing protein [Wallemia mellicola]TIC43769.1 NAF1-domain-containing protein [Wallemia mellicola]TIC52919.1 NAF1-domain-containing protein [Wallemia mellicola]
MESLPFDIKQILENNLVDQSGYGGTKKQSHSTTSSSVSSSSDDSDSGSDQNKNNEELEDDDSDADDQWEVDSNPITQDENPIPTLDALLENADPEDPIASNNQPFHTKNELTDHQINPLPFEKFPVDIKLLPVGHLHSLIDNILVIQSSSSGEHSEIFETFGSISSPFHSILVKEGAIDIEIVKSKQKVFYAPEHAKIIDTRILQQLKGSDASNVYDEEIPENQQEFSDDEAEQSAKKEKKAKNRVAKQSNKNDFIDYVPQQRPATLDYNDNDFNPEVALKGAPQQPQQPQPSSLDQQYNPYQFMPYNPILMAQQFTAMQAQMQALLLFNSAFTLISNFQDDDISSIWKNDNKLKSFTVPKQSPQSDIAFVSLQNNNHAVLHNSNMLTLKNPHNNNINFRELLKPQSKVNYSVSRIIVKTDQQASIFLQQKLKSLNKSDINLLVDAVIQRAFPLITNRFGNFLVQRVIDLDDVSYKLRIVNSITCQVESIAMNSYGTHVLQKLLSTSPEHVKILLVNELLNGNIAQGIVHKNASHVWSKVLELSVNFYGARCLMACLTIGDKKNYAINLLSDLLFNDPDRIDTLANLMASSIGAQFLVNILTLMSNEKYHQLLTLIHAVKKQNAGVIA